MPTCNAVPPKGTGAAAVCPGYGCRPCSLGTLEVSSVLGALDDVHFCGLRRRRHNGGRATASLASGRKFGSAGARLCASLSFRRGCAIITAQKCAACHSLQTAPLALPPNAAVPAHLPRRPTETSDVRFLLLQCLAATAAASPPDKAAASAAPPPPPLTQSKCLRRRAAAAWPAAEASCSSSSRAAAAAASASSQKRWCRHPWTW